MNQIDVNARLVEAFEAGLVPDSVLSNIKRGQDSSSSVSALAETTDASKEQLDVLICSLADTLQLDPSKKSAPVKSLFAYDGGMELSFYGQWGGSATGGATLDFLKPNKQKAVDSNKAIPVEIAGLGFMLLPHGVRSGLGSYSYVLVMEENGRVKYRFYLHTSPCKSIPGVRVHCEYQAFRNNRKLSDLNLELHKILHVLGFIVQKERLSRIDFNLTINHDMKNINDAVKNDRIVNRCEEIHTTGGRRFFSSFRIGNISNIEFAIYDKLKELRAKYDADKVLDLSSVFQGDLSESLTRYEFRLGRAFLHAVGVETLQDYIENEFAVVNYLTLNWFQVLEDPTKRKGKAVNYKVTKWWKQIRVLMLLSVLNGERFFSFALPQNLKTKACRVNIIRRCCELSKKITFFPVVKRRPPKGLRKNLKRLIQVGVGCFASCLVASLPSDQSLDRAQFSRLLSESVNYFSDDAYEKYKSRFEYIDGFQRDKGKAVDALLPLLQGVVNA